MIFAFYLWRFGSWLVTVLPSSITNLIAAGSGISVYYLWGARRRVTRDNFAHVLGRPQDDPEVGRVARASFANYCRYIVSVMRFPSVSTEELEQRVVIHEPEAVRRMQDVKTPVVLISAHFGNMDYVSAVATRRYGPFTLAAETMKPVQLFHYLQKARAVRGVNLVDYMHAPRKLIEALRRKEWVAFLIDFGVNNQKDITNTEVSFFGAPTRFPASPAILAQRTGAPILVAYTYVDQDKRIHASMSDPFFVPKELSREEAAQYAMQAVAHQMEQFICMHPEQWYVYRAMWPQPFPAGLSVQGQNPPNAYESGTKIWDA